MSQTLLTMDGKVLLVDGKLISPNVNLQEKTVTPSETAQVIQPDDGYTGLSRVNVPGIPTVDLATPTINVSSTGLITANLIQPEGYINGGTTSSTEQLETQAAQTIIPTTSDITIASGKYLTGTQIIKGDANLIADNIAKGITLFGIEGTNEGSGGGYAVISVTYPSGSACTCTDGEITFTFDNTSGFGFFLVPYAASWTVACTNGTASNSQVVTITSQGQSVSIELGYDLWIIKDGKDMGVGGFTSGGYTSLSTGGTAWRIRRTGTTNSTLTVASTSTAFNLTPYSKILIRGWINDYFNHETYSVAAQFNGSTVANVAFSSGESFTTSTPTYKTIDISQISSTCNIAVTFSSYWTTSYGDGYADLYIDQLCLVR